MKGTVDPKDTFIIHMNVVSPVQLIPYSAVSHIRMLFVDLLNNVCNSFVLQLAVALRMRQPSIIC